MNTIINDHITISEAPLEEGNFFTYFGSIIDRVGGTDADTKTRIGKATGAFTQLR